MIDKNQNKVISYIVVFFIGCLVMYAVSCFFPSTATVENVTKQLKEIKITEENTGIADAVEKVYDAVVVVSTYKDSTYTASGTGFVYKSDKNKYYILTNHHVIESGNKVTVTFTNGKVIETTIVGSDQYADIAVLSMESKEDIVVSTMGSSTDMRVGDTAFAVGAPLDSAYSWTITRGIVSGKDRMVEVSLKNSQSSDYIMKVLQTDAAINSGNSGGPLCNAKGEVIGITSLKLVSSGVEGMGFAIPIEDAIETAERIIKGKDIEYPYLGIEYLDVASVYNSFFGNQRYKEVIRAAGVYEGVLVVSVEENSAADKAGIKDNDIIVSLGGEKVKSMAYLKYYLFQHSAGDEVKVTVNREGKEKELTVKLGSNKQTT